MISEGVFWILPELAAQAINDNDQGTNTNTNTNTGNGPSAVVRWCSVAQPMVEWLPWVALGYCVSVSVTMPVIPGCAKPAAVAVCSRPTLTYGKGRGLAVVED